jgi:hypothetical protein
VQGPSQNSDFLHFIGHGGATQVPMLVVLGGKAGGQPGWVEE